MSKFSPRSLLLCYTCVYKDFRIDLAGSSTGGIVTRVTCDCEGPEGLDSSATPRNAMLLVGGEDFGRGIDDQESLNSGPLSAGMAVAPACIEMMKESITHTLLREACLNLDASDPKCHADMPADSSDRNHVRPWRLLRRAHCLHYYVLGQMCEFICEEIGIFRATSRGTAQKQMSTQLMSQVAITKGPLCWTDCTC